VVGGKHMSLSKGLMMELTKNTTGVDSALPDWFVKACKELGLDDQQILFMYGYSYKDNTYGKPLNLLIEFINLLEETKLTIHDNDGNVITYHQPTLMELIISILKNYDHWEIRLK
jgi:hypothetical protein